MKKSIFLILIQILFLTSCNAKGAKTKEVTVSTFKSVSMDEGLKLMADGKDFVLLDVRTPEEFAVGHIPGAVQLTNETFTKQDAENLLTNKAQTFMFTAALEEGLNRAVRSWWILDIQL